MIYTELPKPSFSDSGLPWIIGVTGASGTIYARRLLQVIVENQPQQHLHVVFSDAALRVMREEEGLKISRRQPSCRELIGINSDQVEIHDNSDIGAAIASGSYRVSGMVVVPCSMSTLAAVSHGLGFNLIHRAADVVLKERRKLVMVPRETPLSSLHLENMLKLSNLGAVMLPAMPGFYHQPSSISELVDLLVMRILDQMGFDIDLVGRWPSTRKNNLILDESARKVLSMDSRR